MGIIKTKNSNGEWVNVASAEATTITNELIGDLRVEKIQPFPHSTITKNDSAFDLSPYIGENDNFMIFFTTNSGVGGSGCIPLVYIKSDGKLRRLHDKNTLQMYSLNDLFILSSQCEVSYDASTRIFDVVMQEPSDEVYMNAWLFYPAIKEA